MKKNKAIMFDFGGTIDTDGIHWSERFREVYHDFGFSISDENLRKAFLTSDTFLSREKLLRHADLRQNLYLQIFHQFEYLKQHEAGFTIDHQTTELIADYTYSEAAACIMRVAEILTQLQEDYKLALVSNCDGNLDIICREFGLDAIFDVIIDSEIVGLRKPDPAIWALALERLGTEATDTFAVGDSYERDIVPPKKLGCRTIWLARKSWETVPDAHDADHIIKKISEINSVLKLYFTGVL